MRHIWQARRSVRLLFYALGGGLLFLIAGWFWLAHDLPDAETLLDYEPNLPSVVRGIDGEIVHRFERERRVELQFSDLPPQLLNAYITAEDETFWTHNGIDAGGFFNAVVDYISKFGSDERAVGGSTITQQVAKNILVGNEYSITRKLREMILATRIEGVLEKEEIITLYLNEIPLGRRSFGVQAAARAYFDKDVGDLALHEMAYLAILPRRPKQYSREANYGDARERRNLVLTQMEDNGHITAAEMTAAQAAPLGIVERAARGTLGRCGLFLRRSAPPADRTLRRRGGGQREQRLCRRAVGAHFARHGIAGCSARFAARCAAALSRHARLDRADWHELNPGNGDLTAQLASSNLAITMKTGASAW